MKSHRALQPLLMVGLLILSLYSCVKEKPVFSPAVSIERISEITSTSITGIVTATPDGGETILSRGICWSTNPNPTIANSKTIDSTSTQTFTSKVRGLKPSTLYYLRAYAVSSSGVGYSTQAKLSTLGLPPSLTTAGVTNVSETKVTSGGYITSDGGAAVTERGVCWGTSQNPTTNDAKTIDGSGIGTFVSNLTGLLANTTYYLRAYATNNSGTSYGNQVSFTTPSFSDGGYVQLKKATIGRGIDIVFFGDGYTNQEILSGKYASNIQSAVNYFFAIEPYKTYASYFNVYMVYAISQESGISTTTSTINTKFGTKYTKAGTTQMNANSTTCRTYTLKAPIRDINNTLAVLIANSTQYGGTTYIHSGSTGLNTSIVPVTPLYFKGILQHEAGGHGFGNLADEYVENDSIIPQSAITELKTYQSYGTFLNVDVTNNLSNILWNHFIGLSNYSYVNAFEGANLYSHGVWRPENGSLMINNIQYINAPSREIIVKRIMSLAGFTYSFADFQAKDVMELTPGTKAASLVIDKSLLLAPPIMINSQQ